MKDKEAWAIIGQFLVDFRQIAGICWEGLEIPSSPEEDALEDKWAVWHKAEEYKGLLRKILDYIGDVGKRKPKVLWAEEWDTAEDGDTIELFNVLQYGQDAYVIVIEKRAQK